VRSRGWRWLTPVLLVPAALGALLLWGQLQPRPPGFAPTAPRPDAASAAVETAEGTVVPEPPLMELVQYTVDARDKTDWAFFDLDRGVVVESNFDAADWDLAFRRTRVLTNSGVTNPAGVAGVIDLGEVELEGLDRPASDDFVADALGGDRGDELRNPAIGGWYRYDFIRHVVVAGENVYLIRTNEARVARLQFDSYYCDDEAPGCVTFRYLVLPAASDGESTISR